MANVCVFCGSSSGTRATYAEQAHELGTALAAGGHRLVYGGGSVGLMGIVADAVLGAGGEVVGVITEQLVGAEVAHLDVTELEVVSTMHARKALMAERSDGVIVLPGGFGTLDETFEILTWNQLGLIACPVVLLDVEGYFTPLFDFARRAVGEGFIRERHASMARRATTVDEAIALATSPPDPEVVPKWVDQRRS